MRDRTISLAKRVNNISLWMLLMAGVAGLALLGTDAHASTVTGVRVVNQADRIEIFTDVAGPVAAWCTQSATGRWITLDLKAAYGGRPIRQAIHASQIHLVRGGWFRHSPAQTRLAITTTAKVPYQFARLDDDTLKLTVWKSKALWQKSKNSGETVPPPAAEAVGVRSKSPASGAETALGAVPISSSVPAVVVAQPEFRSMASQRPRPDTAAALVTPQRPRVWAAKSTGPAAPAPKAPAPVAEAPKPVVEVALASPATTWPTARVAGTTEVLDASRAKAAKPVLVAKRTDAALEADGQSADKVNLNFVGTDINDVLKALTMQAGVNVITATDVKGDVTVSLQNVDFESALESITKLSGYKWTRDKNTYYVASSKSIAGFIAPESSKSALTEVVALNRANGKDVEALVKSHYPTLSVTVPSDKKDEKKLILSGLPEDVRGAKDLVAEVDISMARVRSDATYEVYNIRYAKAASLILVLDALAPGVTVYPGAVQDQVGAATKMSGQTSNQGAGGQGDQGGPLAPGAAAPNDAGGGSGGTGAGSPADGSQTQAKFQGLIRTLILSGRPEDIAQAKAVLAKIDLPSPQVLIEAKVVDVDLSDGRQQGITYDQSANGFNFGLSGFWRDPGQTGDVNLFLKGSIEALITTGKGRLLAHPKIMVVEGETARIFIGDVIKYIESVQATSSGLTVTTGTVNAGIILECVAQVSQPDNKITLKVAPEVSTPKFITDERTGVTLPQVSTRQADSTIRLADGQTIVIAGLINERELNTLTRIPFLSDLPFLGQLFRHRDKTVTNRELMVFLTCSIVKDKE